MQVLVLRWKGRQGRGVRERKGKERRSVRKGKECVCKGRLGCISKEGKKDYYLDDIMQREGKGR